MTAPIELEPTTETAPRDFSLCKRPTKSRQIILRRWCAFGAGARSTIWRSRESSRDRFTWCVQAVAQAVIARSRTGAVHLAKIRTRPGWDNLLYNATASSTPLRVRLLFLTTFLVASTSIAVGQEQEQKLVDRLLKPNTALANSAQTKQFDGGREATSKSATVRTFSTSPEVRLQQAHVTRDYSTGEYSARQFQHPGVPTDLSSRSNYAKQVGAYDTPTPLMARSAADATRAASTRDFAQNRPFLARGKSQKTLDAKHTSLTIEQVRELLNRNK